MKGHPLISVLGGGIIGLLFAISMEAAVFYYGAWGWLALIVVIPVCFVLGMLVLCLPYYLEERKLLKKGGNK